MSLSKNEKFRLVQKQLALLLHAHKCLKRLKSECHMGVYCEISRQILAHINECSSDLTCTKAFCIASKKIISHWIYCTDKQCAMCSPLKKQD